MNTTHAANVIYETYTMDYTTIVHYAINAAGQWFTRANHRHPRYGYRLSAWRPTVAPHAERVLGYTGRTARLPKGGAQ